MNTVIWLGISLAGVTGSGEEKIDQILLERAQTQDAEVRTACLRVWAARGSQSVVPESLQPMAEAARQEAQQRGRVRVFWGSTEGQLRVGISDPMNVVDGWRAVAIGSDGALAPLVPVSESEGRRAFVVAVDQTTIFVELTTHQCGAPLMILRWPLDNAPQGPPRPPVVRTPTISLEPPPVASRTDESFPWWWFVAGLVAVSFVGAAMWQETRFE